MSAQAPAVDDCWNRIGVQGERSCPQLSEYIHCRNCPVYSAAARSLLDRAVSGEETAPPQAPLPEERAAGTTSLVIFRAGTEHFAIPTRRCVEAVNMRAIHRLPHRSQGAVLGLTNIHGELIVCLSLTHLLQLQQPQAAQPEKLLVTRWQEGPIALAVDELKGVRQFAAGQLESLPATVAHSKGRCSGSVLSHAGNSVGVLDEELLGQAIRRQLS